MQPPSAIHRTISPAVVVEFDTYQNTSAPDANHIAITKDGDPDHSSATNSGLPVASLGSGINLESGVRVPGPGRLRRGGDLPWSRPVRLRRHGEQHGLRRWQRLHEE